MAAMVLKFDGLFGRWELKKLFDLLLNFYELLRLYSQKALFAEAQKRAKENQ